MAPGKKRASINGDGAAEHLLTSNTGRTLGGAPLAFNHSPAEALRPWFCWFSLTVGEVPEGQQLRDVVFNDLPTVRIIFGGPWTMMTRTGPFKVDAGDAGAALFFGPQSHALPVLGQGKFTAMSMQLAAGASTAMGGPNLKEICDCILDYDAMVGHGRLASRFSRDITPEEFLAAANRELQKFVVRNACPEPDPLTTDFEACALANPTIPVAVFAEQHGVTTRTVERVIQRDYGLSPKQVLRRARALDMAALLLGVAIETEDIALRLRYFDQSHLIREMRRFFGMTPRELREKPHPMLRLTLETRQARRVEALELVPPGMIEPWRDPAAEPVISRTAN